MMTPMAQQSTGRSIPLPAYHLWGCKQDPSAGQYQPWPGLVPPTPICWDGDFLHYPESVFEGCVPPCPCPTPCFCPGIRGSTGLLDEAIL